MRTYTVIKQSDNISPYIVEYIVDTEADIASLPTDGKQAWPRSSCLVANTTKVYVLNNSNQWVKLS